MIYRMTIEEIQKAVCGLSYTRALEKIDNLYFHDNKMSTPTYNKAIELIKERGWRSCRNCRK
jgi:hypothetical protein